IVDVFHLERLFVGIEATEALVFGHAEAVMSAFGGFREHIGDSNNLGFYTNDLGGLQKVVSSSRASATEADNNGVDRLFGLAADYGRKIYHRSSRSRRERGAFNELAARDR